MIDTPSATDETVPTGHNCGCTANGGTCRCGEDCGCAK